MRILIVLVASIILSSCATNQLNEPSFSGIRELASELSCPGLVNSFLVPRKFPKAIDPIELIKKKLAISKSIFSIKNNKLIYKLDNTSHAVDIEVITPKYLFEWQDEESHAYWAKAGGITADEMDYILSQKGQLTGRGYYVSLSPTDSELYGSHLTVFEVNRPIVLISHGFAVGELYENEKLLNELRHAGFGGIRTSPTWLNIFNDKYLSKLVPVDQKLIDTLADPSEKIPSYSNLVFKSKPSISSTVEFPEIKNVIAKISEGKSVTSLETKWVVDEFKYSPLDFFKKHKDEKIPRFVFANIDLSGISGIIAFISSLETREFNKFSKQLNELIDSIPHAKSFFELFDAFDLATLGQKGFAEPLNYKKMYLQAQEFERASKKVDLNTIKNSKMFISAAKSAIGLDYAVRSSDVMMSSHEKGQYGLKVTHRISNFLDVNNFLKVDKVKEDVLARELEIEVNYFSVEEIDKVKNLFTQSELNKIKNLDNTATATNLAVKILLDKFFDPAEFKNIINNVMPQEKISAMTLYQSFISLHPFKDGNGRAARLYYKWLVTNHFKKENVNPQFLINEADVFYSQAERTAEHSVIWQMSRLWLLASKNESEMAKRALALLREEKIHVRTINDLLYLNELLPE